MKIPLKLVLKQFQALHSHEKSVSVAQALRADVRSKLALDMTNVKEAVATVRKADTLRGISLGHLQACEGIMSIIVTIEETLKRGGSV